MDITAYINYVISFLLGAVVMYAAILFSSWKSSKGGIGIISFLVEAGCEAAELAFADGGQGDKKLQFVLEFVEMSLKEYNIHFDIQQVHELIEKYVKDVINAGKKS